METRRIGTSFLGLTSPQCLPLLLYLRFASRYFLAPGAYPAEKAYAQSAQIDPSFFMEGLSVLMLGQG